MGNLTDKIAQVMGAYAPELERVAAALLAEVDAMESRLSYLEAWLESRGLPKDWTGPLNHSRYVQTELESVDPAANSWRERILGSYFGTGRRDGAYHWAECTPETRAEALRIEKETRRSL